MTRPGWPSLESLAPLFAAHGLAAPVALEELPGGSAPTLRLTAADGSEVVLKTYLLAEKLPRREAYAAGLVAHLGLLTTRYLAIDETRTHLPYPVAITNYLPGTPVFDLRETPHAPDLYRQMGELLRRLHTVTLPGFGHFTTAGIDDPVATNAEHMQRVASHAFAQFRHYAGDEALASRLEGIVSAGADLFAASSGPVFAHDDLHPNNVLAVPSADGGYKLSGLIDFGNARSADPIFDLAKTLFVSNHNAPGSTPHILAGYGPIDHPDPEAALWLYTLVHRVVMWWWLRHVGVITDGEEHDLVRALRQMAEEAEGRTQ